MILKIRHLILALPIILAACGSMTPETMQGMSDLSNQAGAIEGQRQVNRDATNAAAADNQRNSVKAANSCKTSCNNNRGTCMQQAANARNQPGGIGAAVNQCDAQNRACFASCGN
jgi:hypothetical protein